MVLNELTYSHAMVSIGMFCSESRNEISSIQSSIIRDDNGKSRKSLTKGLYGKGFLSSNLQLSLVLHHSLPLSTHLLCTIEYSIAHDDLRCSCSRNSLAVLHMSHQYTQSIVKRTIGLPLQHNQDNSI